MVGRHRGYAPAVILLLSGLGATVLAGCAGAPAAPETLRSLPPSADPGFPMEELALPPVQAETMDWLTELDTALSGDPSFGAVAIDDTRSEVTITWYGDPSARLTEMLSRAPEGLSVVVHPADFPPGELEDLVRRAMTAQAVPDVELATGSVRNDGSGLEFGIVALPNGLTEAEVAERIAAALDRADVPITVRVSGAVMPLSG